MTALLETYPDRPAVVTREGWTVFVAVHDREYLRQRDVWRQRLRAHPDTGGTSAAFGKVRAAQVAWRRQEAAWYAAHGLTPPVPHAEHVSVPRRGSTPELWALLVDQRSHSLAEMMSCLQRSRAAIVYLIARLRRVGARIVLVRGAGETSYQLLTDEGVRLPRPYRTKRVTQGDR